MKITGSLFPAEIYTTKMDSAKKMKTPKSKKKNLTTPRQGPDGTSVMKKKLTLSQKANGIQSNKKKRASDQENLSPPHSAVGAKKKKKHKLSDDEWDVDETISSVSSKRSKITQDDDSEIEIDVDESIAPQIAKHKAMKSAKKNKAGKKKSSETKMETDVTFEQAVEKARGLPDGADEGDESNEEEAMEIQENKPKLKKPKAAEKKKKGIISSAAKKIKKIAGKSEGLKAQKRKSTDGGGDTPEKVKPEHMKRKERKNMRKMNETDNYAMAARSKQIWNELRRMDLPNEKRVELSNELYKMVGGKVKTMVFAHDTSRVIQCLIKYGTQEHKNAIFEELKDNIVELCKSKYAKFFVRKLLKYGTKGQRLHVFQSLYGNVRKLIKHKEACETIELAYNEYANAQQRHAFIEEFYGPSFAVFKTDEIKTLDQILATHPEKANSILNNMKDSLTSLVDKTLLQYSIVHRIFLDYFLHAPAKARSEMIEVVREHLVHMVHTKEGARVAMMCLWSGTAKDRKAFIKSLKTFVVKICKEEYGHLALLALFDCVDDTKIVHKVILEEMLKSLPEVAQDQYGRKVLLYLLSPRDKKNFHPDIIKLLEPADDPVQNPHSKKEASARRGELLDAVSRPLVQYVAHNAKALVSDNAMLILLRNIITHVKSDPTDAMRAVALLAAEPFAIDSEHIIEQTAGHLTMKKLIVNDGDRMKQGQQASKRESSFAKETKLDTSKQPSTGKPAQNASETSEKVKAVKHEPKTDAADAEKSPRSKLASDPPPPTDIPSASLEHKDRAEQEGETLDPDPEARAKRKKEKRKKKKRKEKRRARELSPDRMADKMISSRITRSALGRGKSLQQNSEIESAYFTSKPPNWQEQLKNIKEMRKDRTAPVDIMMGWDRVCDPEAKPETIRYQVLISLLLSSATKDEVNVPAAMGRLKTAGCDVDSILKMSDKQLGELISPVGLWKKKVRYIKGTTKILQEKYEGDVPRTIDELCDLPGIGRKMAYLIMNCVWGKVLSIGVEAHVHRISNRLGWVSSTKDTERTRRALQDWLPREHWRDIDVVLVGFGQTVCKPIFTMCDICLNQDICPSAFKKCLSKKSVKV